MMSGLANNNKKRAFAETSSTTSSISTNINNINNNAILTDDVSIRGVDAAHNMAIAARALLTHIERATHDDTNALSNALTTADATNLARAVERHDALLAHSLRQSAAREAHWTRVAHLRAQLARRESAMATLCGALREAEAALVSALAAAQRTLPAAEARTVDVESLIAYAQKISYTTAPPPGWTPEVPLGRRRPPFPQDDQLRSSVLFSPQIKAIDARLKAASAAEVVAVRVPELDAASLAAARSLPALTAKSATSAATTAAAAATPVVRFVPSFSSPTAPPPPVAASTPTDIIDDNDMSATAATAGGREELTGLAAKTADDDGGDWE
jgi:hypothetical protein